jgi:hypothetical protein
VGERGTISESFDPRTLANMEIALDRACEILSAGGQKHRYRRHIANRIIQCAGAGNRTLGSLTTAALAAAEELRIKSRRPIRKDAPGARSQAAISKQGRNSVSINVLASGPGRQG